MFQADRIEHAATQETATLSHARVAIRAFAVAFGPGPPQIALEVSCNVN